MNWVSFSELFRKSLILCIVFQKWQFCLDVLFSKSHTSQQNFETLSDIEFENFEDDSYSFSESESEVSY